MTVLVGSLIASARAILLDPSPGDWFTDTDLIGFINTAHARVVLARPELNAVMSTLTLVAGTIQQLPSNAIELLDIYHNTASKNATTQTPRSLLDNGFPAWPNTTPQADVIHWFADPRHKTIYRVYPPNDGSGQVEALVANAPALVSLTSGVMAVPDIYKPAVDAFVLAEAYSANSVKRDLEKASFYENKAMSMLGLNAQSGAALAPKFSAPGGG